MGHLLSKYHWAQIAQILVMTRFLNLQTDDSGTCTDKQMHCKLRQEQHLCYLGTKPNPTGRIPTRTFSKGGELRRLQKIVKF